MTKLCWTWLLGLWVLPLPAQDFMEGFGGSRPGSGWTVAAGPLLLSTPSYPGSDQRRFLFLPAVTADYQGRWFVGASRISVGGGVGYRAAKRGAWVLDLGLGYGEGRPESRASALAGMGNRAGALWVGTTLGCRKGPFQARTSLVHAPGGQGGTRATVQGGFQQRLGAHLSLGLSAQVGVADATNLTFDFAVTPEQAQRRALLLAQGTPGLRPGDAQPYTPRAGLRELGLGTSLAGTLPRGWRAFLFVGVTHLADPAQQSPLVRRATTWSVGLGALHLLT